MKKKNKNKNKNNLSRRFVAYSIIVIMIFILIIVRVGYIQIVKGEEYKDIAENRSMTEIVEPAARGNILDRDNNILAEDKKSYSLIYRETKESSSNFYSIMSLVFETLENNGEKLDDDFELKIDNSNQNEPNSDEVNLVFDFGTTNPNSIKARKLNFMRDRGIKSKVAKEIYGKDYNDLTEDEKSITDEEVVKITPEETFQYLIKLYEIDTKSGLDLESLSYEEIRKYMLIKDKLRMASFSINSDITIAKNISKPTAQKVMQMGLPVEQYSEEKSNVDTEIIPTITGVIIKEDLYRSYPNGELASSALGYLSKINPEQKEKYEEKGYNANTDYIGVSGIEGAFEQYLKGDESWTIGEVNRQGILVSEKLKKESHPGDNVQLTIDSDLQQVAEKALDEAMLSQQAKKLHGDVDTTNATRGAAVVVDVNTGEILALASRPGFDPNVFSQVGELTPELQEEYFSPDLQLFGQEYVNELLTRSADARATFEGVNPDEIVDRLFPLDDSIENNTNIREDRYDLHTKPLFNYATKALIPPGSTFKPLMAVAALEEGVVTPSVKIKDRKYYDKYSKGKELNRSLHPGQTFNIMTALMKSNNYFFYDMGSRLLEKNRSSELLNGGFDSIASYAWQFGLGVPQTEDPYTGIEIAEKFGQVYNYESNKRIKTALYMDSLYNYYFVNGTNDKTLEPYYKPINLNVDSNDNEEIIDQKQIIKEFISESMQKNYIDLSKKEISTKNGKAAKDFKDMLRKLIDIDEEIRDNYGEDEIESQIENVAKAVELALGSAIGEINGAANLISASIGQGINQFTPLQIAMYTATLANGGTRYSANIVDKIIDSDGNIVKDYTPEIINTIDISESTLNTVKAGMKLVVDNPSGTAYSAFKGFPIASAGKTGSATFASYQEKIGRTAYGVYMGFAPYDNPEIAVCVAVFDGGHGGEIAGVARAVYEEYFKEELKTNYPNYVPQYVTNVEDANASLESTEQPETVVTDQIEEEAAQNETEDSNLETNVSQ